MTTISINEAQAKLLELIHKLSPGDEVVITENNRPVARLVSTVNRTSQRQLGTMQGTVLHMPDDFDAPLDDFQECQQ